MAKKKMHKMLTNHVKDSSNSIGGWNRVARFQKVDSVQPLHSGWVSKVKVNFLVDDIDGADNLRSSFPFGHLFALSYATGTETVDNETSQLGVKDIIDIAGRDGGAGTCTLYANRRIVHNSDDNMEDDGYFYLWQKNTDLTVDDNIIMRYYIETYGRWVSCTDI